MDGPKGVPARARAFRKVLDHAGMHSRQNYETGLPQSVEVEFLIHRRDHTEDPFTVTITADDYRIYTDDAAHGIVTQLSDAMDIVRRLYRGEEIEGRHEARADAL